MDPNKYLEDMMEASSSVDAGEEVDESAAALSEHVEAMNAWLSRGGFLPKAWAKASGRAVNVKSLAEDLVWRHSADQDGKAYAEPDMNAVVASAAWAIAAGLILRSQVPDFLTALGLKEQHSPSGTGLVIAEKQT